MKLLLILTVFFVQFTDKGGSDRIALSTTALEMRQERGISIDSLDYAVSSFYLDSIKALGGKILHTSRWMNGATVDAKSGAKNKFLACSFVDTVYVTRKSKMIAPRTSPMPNKTMVTYTDSAYYGQAYDQLQILNLPPLHDAGFEGQGIRIGIADVGFANADSLPALDATREQWLGYADLTDDTCDIFSMHLTHGTSCLSTIMGITDQYTGTATQAAYFLFKTEEIDTESPKEIDNWVAATEMADSMGLHILSTSLGYALFDDDELSYNYADMDGQTTRGALVAQIATRKGMLLVVAMGNDGTNSWHYLSTPADADSILSVGAITTNGIIAPFSSYGPTSDGRIKPEVCAVGVNAALIDVTNDVVYGDGTSFACPQIAGAAACLWSALPKATNMEIRERIIQSADHYAEPHNRYGYGVPNLWKAYCNGLENNLPNIDENKALNVQKIVLNGQLFIKKDNHLYNILGTYISTH